MKHFAPIHLTIDPRPNLSETTKNVLMLGKKTGERRVVVSGRARHVGVLDDVEKWPLALPGEEFQDWLAAVALAAVVTFFVIAAAVAAVALAAAARRAPRRATARKAAPVHLADVARDLLRRRARGEVGFEIGNAFLLDLGPEAALRGNVVRTSTRSGRTRQRLATALEIPRNKTASPHIQKRRSKQAELQSPSREETGERDELHVLVDSAVIE